MRILLDMQAIQTESRFRGIGRYSLAFAQAVIRNRGKHDIIIALNDMFPETIQPIREIFERLLPRENVVVWCAPSPEEGLWRSRNSERKIAELIREGFLASHKPDIIHICSLFEGFYDNAVTSIGLIDRETPISVTLYDLIPLLNADRCLTLNKDYAHQYRQKINYLRQASCLLAISESARQEGLQNLNMRESAIINVSGAIEQKFQQIQVDEDRKARVFQKYGLTRPFILYTGGADERKNLPALMQAFAALPQDLRQTHQLLFVGKMPDGNVSELTSKARLAGLRSDELLFTGYVDDEELVLLYNVCKLFVFPSWHEGFGIPPLEAMACGAPVISSNMTSLPEIIGNNEALFDPFDIPALTAKMIRALDDNLFRRRLSEHGIQQAKRFSWDLTAQKAIATWEGLLGESLRKTSNVLVDATEIFSSPKKRVLVLKLDHMGDLLLAYPALSKLRARYPNAQIDIVVGSWNKQLAEELRLFDHIFILDYFRQKSSFSPRSDDSGISNMLHQLDEYDIAIDLRRQRDTRHILSQVNAKLKVGYTSFNEDIDRNLDIVLTAYPDEQFISTPLNKSSIALQMIQLVDSIPGTPSDFIGVPQHDQQSSKTTCSVAIFPFAGNDVKEWGSSKFRQLAERLCASSIIGTTNIFVASDYDAARLALPHNDKLRIHVGLEISGLIKYMVDNSICVANNSFGAHLASHLGLTVIGIYGGHETINEWAPIYPNSYVIHTEAECSPCHIARRSDCPYGIACLEEIPVDLVYEKTIEAARSHIRGHISDVKRPIITLVNESRDIVEDIINALKELKLLTDKNDSKLAELAHCLSCSIQTGRTKKRLLVDVSELVQHDAKTGIQRVVRSMLGELLQNPPAGYSVEPVYASMNDGYRFARQFTRSFLGFDTNGICDGYIEYGPGDIFLALDLQLQLVPAKRDFYQMLRRWGIQVVFVVYDLLSVQMPQYFPEGNEDGFRQWLGVVLENDGAICISRTVADELAEWKNHCAKENGTPISISWIHLGSDIEKSMPSFGVPENADKIIRRISRQTTFLMVGTIEPRKAHAQVLQAFEQLWLDRSDVDLVIVGKSGWVDEAYISLLRDHPEQGRRLHWLESISDEYLREVYSASKCLIAASYGEGFGLPLIEAAEHNIHILARDIPIFREVAGPYATYFSGNAPHDLELSIRQWLACYKNGTVPQSRYIPRLTWAESYNMLIAALNITIEGNRC